MAGCIPAISDISTPGGNLFITGREKDVIVLSNGKNVYPEEIESYYLKSPYIKEIGVMALESEPGNPASDRLYAVVVPDFDLLKERKIVNAKEVIRFDIEGISAQIPSTKRIGSYEIWQEPLPRTTTRKLKRFELEKRVRANQKKGQAVRFRDQFAARAERRRYEMAGAARGAAGAEDYPRVVENGARSNPPQRQSRARPRSRFHATD